MTDTILGGRIPSAHRRLILTVDKLIDGSGRTGGRKKGLVLSTTILVLIVEDSERFRRFLSTTLQNVPGLRIIGEASDGLTAIQHAEELQPELIVLDIGLPKLNGIEAARVIRERSPKSKILFVSLESSPEVIHEAMNTGAHGYVNKTNIGRDLIPAIRRVLRDEIFLPIMV